VQAQHLKFVCDVPEELQTGLNYSKTHFVMQFQAGSFNYLLCFFTVTTFLSYES
jgi:hypothetical protein